MIATGPETGTYHALDNALKRVLMDSGAFDSVAVHTVSVTAMLVARKDLNEELGTIQARILENAKSA
jgi:TRAP-type uncharacterized transport system substrate-binding protein